MDEEQSERFVEENKGCLVPLAIGLLIVAAFFFGNAVASFFRYIINL